jgi:hypothetical protein
MNFVRRLLQKNWAASVRQSTVQHAASVLDRVAQGQVLLRVLRIPCLCHSSNVVYFCFICLPSILRMSESRKTLLNLPVVTSILVFWNSSAIMSHLYRHISMSAILLQCYIYFNSVFVSFLLVLLFVLALLKLVPYNTKFLCFIYFV